MGLFCNGKCVSNADLTGKVAIITGANAGIGFETAYDLLKRGAKVVMANRNMELSEKVAQKLRTEISGCQIRIVELNLASLKSVKRCANELIRTEIKIHLLINNAGVICPYEKTEDGLEKQFQTNHLGHFLLTLLLLPLLKESVPSRIVNVSSTAHFFGKVNFDDLQSTKSYSQTKAYSQSKLCNILFTLELTKQLEGTGVVVYAVHPGYVATEIGKNMSDGGARKMSRGMLWAAKTPLEGAQTTLHCALDKKLATQRKNIYYSDCAPAMTSCRAKNEKDAEKLWTVSKDLVRSYINLEYLE